VLFCIFCFVAGSGFFADFLLASAFCFLVSCVAPVRGGTYFSLPPQRKVGKRKRLLTSGARQDNVAAHVL
jgi:hypothetical protein